MKIECPISAGELLDKISILKIKKQKINDLNKQFNIKHELNSLLTILDSLDYDEKEVNRHLQQKFSWELDKSTPTSWRIGDGTAPIYNYIYWIYAGFTENDFFRSNQIREGMITRDEALKLIYEENKPRYNSLKWYLKIIGLDYESTIKRINSMPRMYNYNKTI